MRGGSRCRILKDLAEPGWAPKAALKRVCNVGKSGKRKAGVFIVHVLRPKPSGGGEGERSQSRRQIGRSTEGITQDPSEHLSSIEMRFGQLPCRAAVVLVTLVGLLECVSGLA